jgi:hypothetical protein
MALGVLEPRDDRVLGEEPKSEGWTDAFARSSGVVHEENVCPPARSVEAESRFPRLALSAVQKSDLKEEGCPGKMNHY